MNVSRLPWHGNDRSLKIAGPNFTALMGTQSLRTILLPVLAGSLALGVAVIGALITAGGSDTGGVNGFVEALSGNSGSRLGSLGLLASLGFAFAAGMASAVNPCGFAMLPAYLGSNEKDATRRNPVRRLGRALLVGGAVTVGVVVLFGIVGLVIGGGARTVVDIIPWLGLSTAGRVRRKGRSCSSTTPRYWAGPIIPPNTSQPCFSDGLLGAWTLGGGKLYSGIAGRLASHIGDPGQLGVKGYFLFGLSYGTASLSCTLPIFLAVVGTSLAVSRIPSALGQLSLYSLGMGAVIMALTMGMALFQGAMVGPLRNTLGVVQRVSPVLMLVAGSYIVFYWLTIGGLW